jgi:rubrerythrin
MQFKQLFGEARTTEWHARLINTLSLMEYIGARKLMKSQSESDIDQTLLNHMAEEIRHAQILKRLALKMSEGLLDSYSDLHVLGKGAAQTYMKVIDRGVAETLGSVGSFKIYVAVTWLIEERALQVYPEYEAILGRLGFSGYLGAILKDEERHLTEVRANLALPEGVSDCLLKLEAAAFSQFLHQLQ